MQTKIWYSIENAGDGSAHLKFMESEELAYFAQRTMSEPWGEVCAGFIELESDSEIKCVTKVITKEQYLVDKYLSSYAVVENEEEMRVFVQKFFPNGPPKFTVSISKTDKNYSVNDVYVDGVKVAEAFRHVNKSGQVFEDLLNSLGGK